MQPSRLLQMVEDERRYAPERHLRDHAERAEPHARAVQHLGLLGRRALEHVSVGRHELQSLDERGERTEGRAGAVRAGGEGAGDGLAVDVAEVLEREPARRELLVQPSDAHPGFHGDGPRCLVDVDNAVEVLERQHPTVGAGHIGEGVATAHDLDRLAGRARAAEGLDHLDL